MAELDWVQYWFMFPVSIGIATTAMLSGIGGAALFIPIFVIIFPMLGPEYPLTTAAAIGSALMTEVFGFSSGFVGYYRKKLIDFRSAVPFLMVSVPIAIIGAILLATLKEQEVFLKGAYALLMLVLCPVILRHTPPEKIAEAQSAGAAAVADDRPMRSVTGRDGRTYQYRKPRLGAFGAGATGVGGFLTGLLGVGIGEVIISQLVKRNRVPVAVEDGTRRVPGFGLLDPVGAEDRSQGDRDLVGIDLVRVEIAPGAAGGKQRTAGRQHPTAAGSPARPVRSLEEPRDDLPARGGSQTEGFARRCAR